MTDATRPRCPPLIGGSGEVGRAVLWWAVAGVTLLAATLWVRLGGGALPWFDRAGLSLAHAWRSPWLDGVFLSLTWLGSLFLLLPLVAIAGFLLWRAGQRGAARFLVVALTGAALLAQATKHLTLRPRPDLYPALDSVASPFSWPSAHAMQVTAFAVALLLVVNRLVPRHRWRLLPVLVAVVALVGVSRLYLQVHYPSDVLAGTIAAACWTAGLHSVMMNRDAAPSP